MTQSVCQINFLWELFLDYSSNIFLVVYILTTLIALGLIILQNRNPHRTISWLLVIVLLPLGGLILYLFFGQVYRKKKMFSRKPLVGLVSIKQMAQEQLKLVDRMHFKSVAVNRGKRMLMKLLLKNSCALITSNNRVDVLTNGAETYSEIIPAIEKAKHHIHLEYYIISDDKLGQAVKDRLIQKAREGVEVRVIYDDVGSWSLSRRFIKELKEAGVEVHAFIPVRFPWFTSRANFRNHRKLIVIDGQVGFVGGLNIADRYIDGIPGIGPWRDTHSLIEGDAVETMQLQFIAHWFFCSGQLLDREQYVADFEKREGVVVQIISSGPDSDWESIAQAYFSAINSAQKNVYIATPYFMPTSAILTAIKTAALKGVDVRLLIPEKSDTITPKWCTESYIEELLEAGVRVFQFKNGFYHSKLLMVDGIWSSIGTANMDFRSLETNFEINAIFYDPKINRKLVKQFDYDLNQSIEVNLERWQQRAWLNKLRASLARLFSPLM